MLDSHVHHNSKPLSEAQKLRKVIMELIETERAYVKVSRNLFKQSGLDGHFRILLEISGQCLLSVLIVC